MSIPFDYESYAANGVDPKAILVTISTNATPGKGAKDDQLYIDDLELVYTPKVEGIRVFGNEVAGFDPKKTEYEIKVPAEPTADVVVPWAPLFTTAVSVSEGTITLTAFSEDLMNYTTYTLNYTIDESVTNGIDNVNNGDKKVVGIYNLNGQRVYKKLPNQIYVTKYADGTTVKALNK